MVEVDKVICLYIILAWDFDVISTCSEGYFPNEGGKCLKCPEHCRVCRWNVFNVYCSDCESGFWGKVCQSNCSRCISGTKCEKENGFCLSDCRDGYTGSLCDMKCGVKCLICNRTDANICIECASGRYPDMRCDKHCPLTCEKQTCNETDMCTSGCINGYWGRTCEIECSEHCLFKSCFRQNGTCVHGCDSGYGTSCHNDPGDVGIDKGLIIALVIAGAFCLFAVIIVYRFRYKICKKISKKNGTSKEHTVSRDDTELAPLKDTAKALEGAEGALHCQSDIEEGYNDGGRNDSKNNANERQTEITVMQVSETKPKDLERSRIMPTGNTTKKAKSELNSPQRAVRMKMLPDTKHTTNPDKSENYKGKTTLRNFIRRLEKMHKKDYKTEFEGIPTEEAKACHESKQVRNFSKHERNGVCPYDFNRVVVRDRDHQLTYINASYIKRPGSKTADYIACTGPSTEDVSGGFALFWKMIWQHNCQVIAMLNTINERAIPFEQYWPVEGKNIPFEDIHVKCTVEGKEENYVLRYFELKQESEMRLVKQMQYTKWPELGVVDSIQSLLEFRTLVYKANLSKDCPMVVHGSSGVGRTGTFIALDMLLADVEAFADSVDGMDVDVKFDILSCVKNLREQRVKMVETLEQYELLYDALRVSVSKILEEKGWTKEYKGFLTKHLNRFKH